MPDTKTGEVINDLRIVKDWRIGADISDVVLEQRDVTLNIGEIVAFAVDQIVDHDHRRTSRRELPDQFGSDKTRAARNDGALTAHDGRSSPQVPECRSDSALPGPSA